MTKRATGGVPMQARSHVKAFLWFFLQGAVCTAAVAQQDRTVSDPIELSKLLHSIPAYRGDLGSRFTAGGMTVKSVWINKLTRDDVAEDPQSYALGDIELHFVADKPDVPDCRILGSPVILVSADVILTHLAEVSLTHLGEDGGFCAADADSGASSGNQGIGKARDGGAGDSEADGTVAQYRAPLPAGRTGGPLQAT